MDLNDISAPNIIGHLTEEAKTLKSKAIINKSLEKLRVNGKRIPFRVK